ncbi:MAG: FkbM family methyltransferase [Flavobacteriaceae bacterium]|nr:FkbM family methyltransferase [Flavobacteriaceae bacterium]
MMAQAYNSAVEIHAFELQPNVFDVLKKNVEINSFKVVCNPIALSDEVGSFPFYNTGDRTFLTENTNHGSLNKQWRLEKQRSIQVEVQRLDAYWSDKSKKIELIKIDVETFEYEVLKGYATLLFDTALSYYWKLRIKKSGEGLLRFSRTRNLVFFMFMKKMGFLRQ